MIDPWSQQQATRPAQGTPNTQDIFFGSMNGIYSLRINVQDSVLLSLERALAAKDIAECLQALQTFDKYYQPRYVRQAFETLLVLREQITNAVDKQRIFGIFQRHLEKSPIELLAFAAGHSLSQEQQICWQFEELLSQLVPHLPLAQLLNQIHQTGSITIEEIRHLVPVEQSDKHTEAERFAVLLEAGIQIQESGTETQLADTQQLVDLHELYDQLSVYYIESIRQYLLEIGQYKLLTPEQERRLALLIREGKDAEEQQKTLPQSEAFLQKRIALSKQAYEQLTQANLRLVVSIARKYINRGLDLLDIIQEGNIGLMRAVNKYDVTKGYRFSTYATWWIRQAITRAIADQKNIVRLPVYIIEEINKLAKAKRELMQQLERDPNDEEIAEHLQMPVEKVRHLFTLSLGTESLDASIGDDTESTLGDIVPQEDSDPYILASQQLFQEQIRQLLSCLSKRQRTVLELRFGIGDDKAHTLEEVGKKLRVTRERVRQIEEKALKKLRIEHYYLHNLRLEDFIA